MFNFARKFFNEFARATAIYSLLSIPLSILTALAWMAIDHQLAKK